MMALAAIGCGWAACSVVVALLLGWDAITPEKRVGWGTGAVLTLLGPVTLAGEAWLALKELGKRGGQ